MEENDESLNEKIISLEMENENQKNIEKEKEKEEEEKENEKKLIAKETDQLKPSPDNEELNDDEKEKQYLIKIFHKIERQLTDKGNRHKSLSNIYNDMMNPEDDEESNFNIITPMKEQWNNCLYRALLHFMFLFLLPLFTIVNLIGIFQILSIMNILYEAIKTGIYCYFGIEDEEESYDFYNFYGYYIKESLDEGIDFDLMTTMSFFGALLYKYSGFIYSSFVFLIINVISFFLIIYFFSEYKETNEVYNFGQIVYLIACYLLLFIGAGSSALFSQTILKDSYFKYREFLKKRKDEAEEKKNKDDEEKKNKDDEEKKKEEEEEQEIDIDIETEEEGQEIDLLEEDKEKIKKGEEEERKKKEEEEQKDEKKKDNSTLYFFLICLTSVVGFFGKYSLNIVISNQKFEFDSQYNITDINTNINNATDNETEYIIGVHKEIFNHDRKLFCYIFVIYFSSIILSLILYFFFNLIFESDDDNVENDEIKEKRICQLCGYTIFSDYFKNQGLDKSVLPDKQKKKRKRGIITAIIFIYEFIKYYVLKIIEYIKLLFFSIKSCCDEIICRFFCCGKKEAKCCCCYCIKDIDDKEYDKEEHFFCYCYQGQRKLKWFNRLIRNKTQEKLVPIMLEFFILQLTTIGFEKMYNDISEDNDNYFKDSKNIIIYNLIFIGSLLLFFYLTISFGSLFNFVIKDEKFQQLKGLIETISNDILNGTYGILIFNAFYSFSLSIKYLLKGIDDDDNFLKIYILIPVFMNKFYFFTFTHVSSIYTDEEEGIELISFSTLIAIYLAIWDTIIGYITDYIPLIGLFIIQIVASSFIIFITLFIAFIFLFFIQYFWLSLLYILSFIFALGGFWFCKCFKNHNFYKSCKCCENHQLFCSTHIFHQKFYYCLGKCIGKENYNRLKEKLKPKK